LQQFNGLSLGSALKCTFGCSVSGESLLFFLGSLQLNQKLIAFAYYGDARVAGDFAAAA